MKETKEMKNLIKITILSIAWFVMTGCQDQNNELIQSVESSKYHKLNRSDHYLVCIDGVEYIASRVRGHFRNLTPKIDSKTLLPKLCEF